MTLLLRLPKRLKDILKAPSVKAVEVSVDKFVTLAEQAILPLSQASLSVSNICRLNILKMIMEDPRKAKTMLKENEDVLRESEIPRFGNMI